MTAASPSSPGAQHGRSQIALLCDAGRRHRYADRYETPAGVLDVVGLDDADPSAVAAAVIDTATAPPSGLWSRIDVPVLISPELLVREGFAAALPAGLDWAALMPWPHGIDVVAAANMVAQGRLGAIWQVRLGSGVGEPPHPSWETDEWWAYSPVEAVFGGLVVSETLARATVVSTRVSTRTATALCLEHALEGGGSVLHTTAPSVSSGLPWLSAELFGDRGRIQINGDFAPGNVAVWDPANLQFEFPAVPFAKPNVQAADSSKGGWDITALLTWMVNQPGASRSEARAQVLRLARLLAAIQL